MNQEQRIIAEDFINMIEAEYALCVREIQRANGAIVKEASVKSSEKNNINLDLANREIDSISKYWQLRLGNLVELIETKNHQLNEELAIKYLSQK